MRPEVVVSSGIDQLGGDAHPAARAENGALHDGVGAQLPADLRQRLGRSLVLHDGGARDHPQGAHLPKVGDQFIGHPVSEVLLVIIAGKILERQDCQRADRRRRDRSRWRRNLPAGQPLPKCRSQEGEHPQRKDHGGRYPPGPPWVGSNNGIRLSPQHHWGSTGLRRRLGATNRGDEAIATSRQGFDIARRLPVVAEGFPQFIDGFVQAVLEVHEGVCGPELQTQVLARDQLARPCEQQGQNLKRLFLKLDSEAMLAQLTRGSIQLKDTEPDNLG